MEKAMGRIIGYVRVSTEGQAQDGISLEVQRQKVEEYCDLHDLPLAEVICDDGYSAKNLNRPGMQRLLVMVAAGEIDAVVCYKWDRISRRTRDVLDLVERFEQASVALHSIQESLDTKSAIGRFVLRTLASLAEMERDLISERTKDAMAHLKTAGKLYSRPTFSDQHTILWMRQGHQAGRSYAELATELNHRGVETARGGIWHASTVQRVLKAHR
jgi:site-specific DNA recombinase